MHGAGNDYIYLDCMERLPFGKYDPGVLARKLSDRHFGIGGDGLVLILPSQVADCRMQMYNADGSIGKMCGNAIRCVGKFVYDRKNIIGSKITVETESGIKKLIINREKGRIIDITVNMGSPGLEPGDIPVNAKVKPGQPYKIKVEGETYEMTFVSMGNPHGVIFTDNVNDEDVAGLGPVIEKHKIFPEGINTEFVQVLDRNTISMRVWERGSEETLACGTGACAATVASVLGNKTDRNVTVKLPGGELKILWEEKTGDVYMTGPAEFVFYGYINPDDID